MNAKPNFLDINTYRTCVVCSKHSSQPQSCNSHSLYLSLSWLQPLSVLPCQLSKLVSIEPLTCLYPQAFDNIFHHLESHNVARFTGSHKPFSCSNNYPRQSAVCCKTVAKDTSPGTFYGTLKGTDCLAHLDDSASPTPNEDW